jgi:hypothetical protein
LSALPANVIIGLTTSPGNIIVVDSLAGYTRGLRFNSGNSQRWNITVDSTAESGNNAGSLLDITAYTDTGAFSGFASQGARGSGPFGSGYPYWQQFAVIYQTKAIATSPGGTYGNSSIFGATADKQPTASLASVTNPISVVLNSNVVTITWPNACIAGGPIGPQSTLSSVDPWVNLTGVATVGGITPTGWLEVQSVTGDNTFTVNWTSDATATASGGGANVSITPSFNVSGTKFSSTATANSGGFAIQHQNIYAANPAFNVPFGGPSSAGASFQQNWSQVYSPPDASKLNTFSTYHHEVDLINRASDEGYSPDLFASFRPTVGFWAGVTGAIATGIPGGGTPVNWNTVYAVKSPTNGMVANYTGFSVQPHSLVGAANDPSGHGGVAADYFGAYAPLPNNPFTTANGTSTVTVALTGNGAAVLASQVNGNSIYLLNSITLNGVTFGAGSYVISNLTTSSFTITGSGTASASGSGGGGGQVLFYATLVPYGPAQLWGEWAHGITANAASRFDSGFMLEPQVGQGVGWYNGSTNVAFVTTLPSGAVQISGPAPTIASGFGTGASVAANSGPTSFSINVGTGGTATGGVITLPAAPHGWACVVNDVTNGGANSTVQTACTTTSVTVTNYNRLTGAVSAWTASDILQCACFPN